MKNLAYILEIIWLILSVLCLLIAIYTIVSPKTEVNYMFMLLSVVAFLMFLLRRFKRLKASSNQ